MVGNRKQNIDPFIHSKLPFRRGSVTMTTESSLHFNSLKTKYQFMNNTIVHSVSQTYQALKALTVALLALIHSINTEK